MQLRAKAEKANFSLTEGENAQFVLRLDCSAPDDDGVLEIGERYAFTAKASRHLLGKRKSCNLRVWVKRRSSAGQKAVEKLGLSPSKIGELGFYPPSEKGDFFPGRPAALEAMAFVSDELFDGLVTTLRATKPATWLVLEIEKQGVLEYGWEPDGSRRIWKLESVAEPSYVDVEMMEIGFDLLG